MRNKTLALFLLLALVSFEASAQSDKAVGSANCNASFLVDCDTSTESDTTVSSAFGASGSAAPFGALGNSPFEAAFMLVLGLTVIRTARKAIQQRRP